METVINFIYSLNPQYFGIAVAVVMLIVTALFAALANSMMTSDSLKKKCYGIIDKNKEAIKNSMKVSKIKSFNSDDISLYISRSGLGFMFNEKLTPLTYVMIRIGLIFALAIIGLQSSIIGGLVGAVIGYFALDFLANASNKSDNDKMLEDIKNVYDTLRIQTKAGVYITSVITDCYLVVQNKRLKKAFLRLTSDIAAKNDVDAALDEFRNKFENEYINALVIIIKQSMKTGQATKMFEDIRAQITDIEVAMMESEKRKVQLMITICQVILYTAIIAVSIYIAVVALQSGLGF